jgi:hypothetical protein
MTYAWRSPLDASRPRFLEIRGRSCLSSRLIDWERFLERSTRSIDPGFTSTLLSRTTIPKHRGRSTGPIRLISDIALDGSTAYFSLDLPWGL